MTRIMRWAANGESRYICVCNVHSVVTARGDPEFAAVINGADLVTPDGAPIAWCLRRMGFQGQRRVSGPDLMWSVCVLAARDGVPVFLYGGSEETLARLRARFVREFPGLRVAGSYSPPYRRLTGEEQEKVVSAISGSGARAVFVALGCPKQEIWMARHKGKIPAVMIGVGAAFAYHAGLVKRAPPWMQDAGLEWLHRLISEPRRLWRRYLVTNALFVGYLIGELLRGRKKKGYRWTGS